jgi:hypothetical protein
LGIFDLYLPLQEQSTDKHTNLEWERICKLKMLRENSPGGVKKWVGVNPASVK